MKNIIGAILPVLALSGATPLAVAPAATPAPVPMVGLIGMGLNVADMERSMKFYVQGLGMKVLSKNETAASIEQFLGYPAMPYPPMLELLARKTAPGAVARPAPVTSSFKIVMSVNDADAINRQLKAAGFSPPPVRVNATTGAGSFFVKDPDSYSIEIVQRPVPAAK